MSMLSKEQKMSWAALLVGNVLVFIGGVFGNNRPMIAVAGLCIIGLGFEVYALGLLVKNERTNTKYNEGSGRLPNGPADREGPVIDIK